ncbi:MAG TPA: LamG domain-containing protein [Chitinophagales bacterium]|nr:LamG domain-containing protein [Chitinophagales bacterium]
MKLFLPLLLLFAVIACKKEAPIVPDITTGLVMNIALDGNAYDSVNAISGIVSKVNPYFNRHNEPNKSMLFNRNDSSTIDFGDLDAASFPTNQFTISCWINVPDTIAPMTVLSKRGEFGPWEYSLDNHFNHAVFNLDNWVQDGSTTVYGVDPLKASATFQLNTWQHFTYVADGTSLRVYLNGVLQPGEDVYKTGFFLQNTTAHFIIGNGGGYGKNYYFDGCIDDIRIYNYPLDATTIQYLAGL